MTRATLSRLLLAVLDRTHLAAGDSWRWVDLKAAQREVMPGEPHTAM